MTGDPSQTKARAALASVGASAFLALAKLAAGLLSGSLALISDAGHAALDTLATALTYFAVTISDRPADEEHHYGHAKIEAVSALVETGFLFFLAILVVVESVHRLISGPAEPLRASWFAFGVLSVSIVVDLVRWRSLRDVARRTGSHALAADALHFASDCLSSCLVLIGLWALKLGFRQGDSVAAIGVAFFIALAGWRLGRRTIDALIDAAPKGLSQKMRSMVEGMPGVVGVDALKLRPSGAHVLGEIEIAVARTTPIEKAEELRNEVTRAITSAMPEASITVTATPVALDNETIRERVMLIAARRRQSVHHVTAQELGGRTLVSLDVELDRMMSLTAAHDAASGLERAIRVELGPDIEVETHIEPQDPEERVGAEEVPAAVAAIHDCLDRQARAEGIVTEVHSVRARRTPAGLIVNYHCHAPGRLPVYAVHEAVDRLDHAARAEFPDIVRIVGHAEPIPDA